MTLYARIDVHFPDDPKVIAAGDLAELAYIRCFLRSREFLTDGIIDRRVLGRWLAGIRGKHTAHMDRLVEVGMLKTHPAGWVIPEHVWRRWNPTKAEVDEAREAETERKRAYREARRSQPSPTTVPSLSRNGPSGTDGGVPGLSQARDRQPEPEPEPEPEPKPKPKPKPSLSPLPVDSGVVPLDRDEREKVLNLFRNGTDDDPHATTRAARKAEVMRELDGEAWEDGAAYGDGGNW